MAAPLHLLMVEDNPADAELTIRELKHAGFEPEWVRVDSEIGLRENLNDSYDIVICDYNVPGFGGEQALAIIRQSELDIPFLLVTGSLGEEKAVGLIRDGVTDYIIKDNMARLGEAVRRALSEKQLRVEKKLAERQLRQLSRAVEQTASSVVITSLSGEIEYVNPRFSALSGYSPDEVIGKSSSIVKSGETPDENYKQLWRAITSGKDWRGEFVNRRKDGTTYLVSVVISPITDERGQITHFIGIQEDITAKRQAERALRESEERLQRLAENVPDVIYRWRMQPPGLEYISAAIGKVTGRYPDEFYEKPNLIQKIAHPDDRERVIDLIGARHGQGTAAFRIIHKDGSVVWIERRSSPVHDEQGNHIATDGILSDVTARFQREEEIRKFLRAVEQSANGVFIADTTGAIEYVNPQFVEITGYAPEDILGKSPRILMSGDTSKAMFDAIWKSVKAGKDWRGELRNKKKNGDLYWVSASISPIRDASGQITHFVAIEEDTTERKLAEEAIKESHARLSAFARALPDLAFILDSEGTYIEVLATQEGLLIEERENLTGRKVHDVLPKEQADLVVGVIGKTIRTGEGQIVEYVLNVPIGQVWFEGRTALLDSIPGEDDRVVLLARDITERKRAEEAERESLARLAAFANALPDLAFVVGADGMQIDVLSSSETMLIEGAEQQKGRTLHEILPKEQADLIIRAVHATIRTGETTVVEYELDVPAGHRWFEGRTALMESAPNEPKRVALIVRDISERKLAEQSLIYEQNLMNSLMDNLPDTIYFKDSQSRFIRANPATVKKHGLETAEDLLGKTDFDFFNKESAQAFFDAEQEMMRTGKPRIDQEEREDWPGRPTTWVSTTEMPLRDASGNIIGVFGVSRDITERHESEERLLALQVVIEQRNVRLEALYRAGQLLNSTLDFEVVLKHLTSEAMEATQATHGQVLLVRKDLDVYDRKSLIGYNAEEEKLALATPFPLHDGLNGKAHDTHEIMVVDDIREVSKSKPLIKNIRSVLIIPIIREDEVLGNLELQSPEVGAFHDTDLDYLRALADRAALAIQNARLYENLEAYSTILEQAVKDRTADLERSQQRLESILNNSPDPILLLGAHATIDASNPALNRMFLIDSDALHGKPLSELASPEHEQTLAKALDDVVKRRVTRRVELTARRADGTLFDADMALAPINEAGGRLGAVAIIRDITALKEVERMKDQFVSNVSHELRTPITGIKLNLDLLKRDPDGHERYVGRLSRESGRLNELIEDLLRLSRLEQGRVELNLAPTDLAVIASQYATDRQPLAESKGLTLVKEGEETLPPASADEGLVGQALSVLLTNAINYTPASGTITITAVKQTQGDTKWVGISVSDTGPGIPEEDKGNLFKRFSRGKVGRESGASGTGLGLSIAKEIIDRHGGRIDIESEGIPGKGTTFTIWLPENEADS